MYVCLSPHPTPEFKSLDKHLRGNALTSHLGKWFTGIFWAQLPEQGNGKLAAKWGRQGHGLGHWTRTYEWQGWRPKKPGAVTGSVSQEAPWLRRRENQSWHSAWALGNVEIILGDQARKPTGVSCPSGVYAILRG